VSDKRRLVDFVNGGRRQAVGEDIVVCKCAQHPRIIAVYGKKWKIVEEGDAGRRLVSVSEPSSAPSASSRPAELQFERWFYVWNSMTGAAMPNRDFIAIVGGARQSGRTDGNGYARIVTDGEQPVEIHITFNAPKRNLNPAGS